VPLTVGTAGHIDHGKTWLVRALTGKDTDRLPEERDRGISIDLGYAPLELADGRRLSLIDVPGHERFVRNMVAGATGIDLFLLVIDAGEGARPQTHEHLAIIRLLGIEHGVVAVTKADAVDPDLLDLVVEEARELVPGAAVVTTSEGATRLFVDRVFTLRGIGTVVTGTLWSGSISEGDVLRAEPQGLEVRVRSVQVHDTPVVRAEAGQRVAVALPGVERQRLVRGNALVEEGAYRSSYRLDIGLEEMAEIPDGMRLHVHHGTAEHYARFVRAGRFAQLRLASPAVAARGDRIVLRERTTLGGGTVLDPNPPRHADPARFELLERGEVAALVYGPVRADSLKHISPGELDGLTRAGDWVFSEGWLEEQRADLRARLASADPLDPGVAPPSKPWARDVLPLLGVERRGARVYLPGAEASLGERAEAAEALEAELEASGFTPVKVADKELVSYLERAGRLVRLGDGLAVGARAYEEAKRLVVEECEREGSITLARLRDLIGAGRKQAQLLLERFDADGLTRRVGDARVLRRKAKSG
jgi:selenocysteine-specific elongation factor